MNTSNHDMGLSSRELKHSLTSGSGEPKTVICNYQISHYRLMFHLQELSASDRQWQHNILTLDGFDLALLAAH